MPNTTRFSIRTLLIVIAFVALAIAWYVDRTRLDQQHQAMVAELKEQHDYEIFVEGTPGVRLDLTVVTTPTSKEEKTITVPFKMSTKAVRVSAWTETLPDGQSGNDGDEYQLILKKDGRIAAECIMHITRKENRTECRVGDL